ncbi:hypothetical protein AACT_1484 [Arcobacter acticola]|uniref:Uncharacterized protein n=1 Tax=Arcobacter acticola TaxID=1849015 RepID=A0A6M8EJI5_9BACT|nr:hypothetical protein AACT_1484 [Arcobacter acticola]
MYLVFISIYNRFTFLFFLILLKDQFGFLGFVLIFPIDEREDDSFSNHFRIVILTKICKMLYEFYFLVD